MWAHESHKGWGKPKQNVYYRKSLTRNLLDSALQSAKNVQSWKFICQCVVVEPMPIVMHKLYK